MDQFSHGYDVLLRDHQNAHAHVILHHHSHHHDDPLFLQFLQFILDLKHSHILLHLYLHVFHPIKLALVQHILYYLYHCLDHLGYPLELPGRSRLHSHFEFIITIIHLLIYPVH